jgi:site-specific DNA-adenine methylase
MIELKPFFWYFGGKWRAALKYPKPEYDIIIEPFAGAAGYSLRYPHKRIILNDLDPVLAGIWNFLIHVSESEIRALPLEIEHTDEINAPQEAKDLIGFWLNAGVARPATKPCNWMKQKNRGGSVFWGESVRERIASQLQYIRHWTIHNKSYSETQDEIATWFVDPPYQKQGRHYAMNQIDFDQLASFCRNRRGQVIVCEQEGAMWLPFERFAGLQRSMRRGLSSQAREVIYTHGCDPMPVQLLLDGIA